MPAASCEPVADAPATLQRLPRTRSVCARRKIIIQASERARKVSAALAPASWQQQQQQLCTCSHSKIGIDRRNQLATRYVSIANVSGHRRLFCVHTHTQRSLSHSELIGPIELAQASESVGQATVVVAPTFAAAAAAAADNDMHAIMTNSWRASAAKAANARTRFSRTQTLVRHCARHYRHTAVDVGDVDRYNDYCCRRRHSRHSSSRTMPRDVWALLAIGWQYHVSREPRARASRVSNVCVPFRFVPFRWPAALRRRGEAGVVVARKLLQCVRRQIQFGAVANVACAVNWLHCATRWQQQRRQQADHRRVVQECLCACANG